MKALHFITCLAAAIVLYSCSESVTKQYPLLIPEYEPTPIDLGLSVKWAEVNVGAEYAFDSGYRFFYGSIIPTKDKSTNKYNYRPGYDYSIAGDIEHDPATKYWGENWRMPTEAQFQELRENCTFTPAASNSVMVTGPNGNCIYIPNLVYFWTASTNSHGTPLCYGINGYYLFRDATTTPDHGYFIRPIYIGD